MDALPGVIVLNSAFTIILFDSILMKKPPVITPAQRSFLIWDMNQEHSCPMLSVSKPIRTQPLLS